MKILLAILIGVSLVVLLKCIEKESYIKGFNDGAAQRDNEIERKLKNIRDEMQI